MSSTNFPLNLTKLVAKTGLGCPPSQCTSCFMCWCNLESLQDGLPCSHHCRLLPVTSQNRLGCCQQHWRVWSVSINWGHGVVGEAPPSVPVGSGYQVTLGWCLRKCSIFVTWTDKLISYVGKWGPIAIVALCLMSLLGIKYR